MEWEVGVSRCKMLYINWINSEVLLYSTGNYTKYSVIKNNGKKYFPGDSNGKESACSARDLALIPGSGRSAWVRKISLLQGKGYPL